MILIIDNYDSFTYNLYQYAGQINPRIAVVRNDAVTIKDIKDLNPSHIIISPGPGFPAQAGIIIDAIKTFHRTVPILGICLGHQAIGEAFGGKVVLAKELVHGKQSNIHVASGCSIFHHLPPIISAARYHSLIVEKESLPSVFQVIAEDNSGEIMGIKHQDYNVFGIQFHPESILTDRGMDIIANFLEVKV